MYARTHVLSLSHITYMIYVYLRLRSNVSHSHDTFAAAPALRVVVERIVLHNSECGLSELG